MKKSVFDRIDPAQCINARVRRLHKLLDHVYQERLKVFGLKGSMLSMLFLIGKQEGITQSGIAERLVLDQSTVSRDLKKLIERGVVEAAQGEDPRSNQMKVTLKGYELLDEIAPVWADLHRDMSAFLGNFQIQVLDQLIRSVQAYGDQ